MKEYKEYLIEDFKNEFEEFITLIGIASKDRNEEAEENKLSGFVAIEKLLPFYKSCKNVQDHILNPLLEEKGETEEDKKVEENLPSIFKSSVKKDMEERLKIKKEERKERLAGYKEFEELNESEQKEIVERLGKYYEIDPDRFNVEVRIIAQRFGVRMTNDKANELMNKKDLENFEDSGEL